MLSRYLLLNKTVHGGDNAVSREYCYIPVICLTSAQKVWVHVNGLASTSTSRSKVIPHPPDLKKQQMLFMLTMYLLSEMIHVSERAVPRECCHIIFICFMGM